MKGKPDRQTPGLFFIAVLHLISSCHPGQDESFHTQPMFTPVATEHSGIDFVNSIRENERQNFLTYPYFYNGGGVAIGDVNNDGLPDLYFTGNMEGDRLYLNRGNLQFTDVTLKAGITKQNLWTTGVTMADVNNDGFLDIYVCRSGDKGFRHNLLYINQGNSQEVSFSEEAREWGVNDNGYATQATFFDYDLDGDLDMYLVNHSNKFNFNQEDIFKAKFTPEPEEADQLYRNDSPPGDKGGGIFTNVSKEAGIQRFAFGLSATVGDINGDGYPDIYAASDFFEPDFLYLNQQDGPDGNPTFKENLQESMAHISFSSMGSDVADYNNDGLLDIVVADMRAADHYRFQANMAGMSRNKFARMVKEKYHYQYMQNTLQLNRGLNAQGLPLFSEVGELAGISSTDWSWSALLFDMDNDGWKDLFISNGIRRDIQNKDAWRTINNHLHRREKKTFMEMQAYFPEVKLQNYAFHNNQQLGFTDVSATAGIDFKGFSNGAAYADLDNDGDLDLVLNNLDDPAMIYENLANQHYLQIRLRGREDNHFGLGAKVHIYYGDQQQFQELTTTRGFQSSVPPVLHFGLGNYENIDKVIITWPNGTSQELLDVKADQQILIDQKDAQPSTETATSSSPWLQPTQTFQHVHQEGLYDDFSREPLLPYKLSSNGPCFAIGDVNGDQLDDFYAGSGKGYPGTLYIQQTNGTFEKQQESFWEKDRNYEDTDAVFFDADQDGDMDLYIVSGSNEFEPNSPWLQDRLYINYGNGYFTKAELPDIRISGSCVAPADVDQDGDLDVFVGGKLVPGQYPLAPPSYLLMNENGTFTPQAINMPGMVKDAVWADIDYDQDEDLLVVGEWMPISIFENQNGELVANVNYTVQQVNGIDTLSTDLRTTSGWWNCITPADLDRDGDLDFILGNAGLNTRFSTNPKEPLEIYAKDFDETGSLDAIMGYVHKGQLYPVVGKDKLLNQLPSWQQKFPDYETYAQTTIAQLLAEENPEDVLHLQAAQWASCALYNEGNGTFTLQELPIEAQLSAIKGVVATDINQDGHTDLIMAGNHYDWEVETARNDAGLGLCLLGNGKREFQPLSLQKSGFIAAGDVRALEKITLIDSTTLLMVGSNRDTTQCFLLPSVADSLVSLLGGNP